MNKCTYLLSALLLSAFTLQAAEDIKVMQFLHTGPVPVNKPIMADSLNVNGKPFEIKNLLKSTVPFDKAFASATILDADTAGIISFQAPEKGYALHLFSFYLNSDRYTKGTLEVSGPGSFDVYVNNKPVSATSELTMEPHRYEVVVKYLTADSDTCPPTLKAIYKSKVDAKVVASPNPDKRYTSRDILEGTNFRGVSLSPNGKYVLVKYYTRLEGGKSESYAQLREAASGRILLQDKGFIMSASWMPTSNKMYFTRTGMNGKELVTCRKRYWQITCRKVASILPRMKRHSSSPYRRKVRRMALTCSVSSNRTTVCRDSVTVISFGATICNPDYTNN